MKKRVLTRSLITGMALMMAVATIGCGSSMNTAATDCATAEIAYSNSKGFYSDVAVEEYEYTEAKAVAPTENTSTTTNTSLENTGRKLIKEVRMSVETEEFDEFLVELERKIDQAGGYKEQYTVNGSNSNRYADITIRIPRAQLDAFLQVVEGTSNITYRNETVEDVTLQYVDLESHKKMLYAEQERLLEFLSRAEKIEDVITLEERLTEVQYQIERMESQLRTFSNQIEYSTVYLDVAEVVRYTPQEPKGMWERITTGFSEDMYDVCEDIKDGFVDFVTHIPSMIIALIRFAITIVIIVLVVKVVRKVVKKYTKKDILPVKKAQTPSVINQILEKEQTEEKK